jgi:hypothetical protein
MGKTMKIFLIVYTILFVSCASQSIVINKEYYKKDYKGKYLLFYPLSESDIAFKNEIEFKNDFRLGDSISIKSYAAQIINNIVNGQLSKNQENINVLINSIRPSELTDIKHDIHWLKIGKDNSEIGYSIPRLNINNVDENQLILLKIGNLFFKKATQGNSINNFSSQCLVASCGFIVWDYSNKKPISYGSLSVDAAFLLVHNKSTWYDAYGKLIEAVLLKTPFPLSNKL